MLSNKSLGNQSSTFDKEEDSKFKGRHVRIDGKQITETQIHKIEANQKIKDAEENYDPRLNRLVSKTRNKFHYVEI